MTIADPALRELDAQVAILLYGWKWMILKDDHRNLTALVPPLEDRWMRWNLASMDEDVFDQYWKDSTPDAPRFSDWDRCGGIRYVTRVFPEGPWSDCLPPYSSDLNACRMMENDIDPNIQDFYACALKDELPVYSKWNLITASPESRCRALIKAFSITKEPSP